MNINQIRTLFALVFLIISCKDPESKQPTSDINSSQYKEHYIDFLNGYMILPPTFIETNPRKLVDLQVKQLGRPDLKEQLLKEYRGLESTTKWGFKTFVDTTDSRTYLFLRKFEYVELSKELGNQYLGLVRQSTEHQWIREDINFERLENKIVQTDKSKYIKIKYRLDKDQRITYRTQFLMTNKKETFDILVTSAFNTEVEDWVKRTVIND